MPPGRQVVAELAVARTAACSRLVPCPNRELRLVDSIALAALAARAALMKRMHTYFAAGNTATHMDKGYLLPTASDAHLQYR